MSHEKERGLLVDPMAGPVLLEIVCPSCGRRPVGVVQRDGRAVSHSGPVLSGPVLRYLMGKARIRGNRAYAVGEKVLRDGLTERHPFCPRHGELEIDLGSIDAEALKGNKSPRVISAIRR